MPHDFETLFLLVGTNPLPNYVVAMYFIMHNPSLKNIFLFYSEENLPQKGTYELANNLKELLKNKILESKQSSSNKQYGTLNIQFHLEPIKDVSRGDIIENSVKKVLDKIRHLSFHLNYTGGTKVMGLYTYRALERFRERKSDVRCSFSYLDARKYSLVHDESGVSTDDLRKEIKLSHLDLLCLHGFKDVSKKQEFRFQEALKKFEELIENDRIDSYFESYNRKIFLKDDGRLISKKKDLIERLVQVKNTKDEKPPKAEGVFLEVVLSMPKEYRIFDEEGNIADLLCDEKLEKAIKFLDGLWLEWYVYEILKKEFDNFETVMSSDIPFRQDLKQ